MQSKRMSFVESLANVFLGWLVAFIFQLVVFPLVNIHVDLATNFEISVYFTIISLIRSYTLRRLFNARGNC